MDGVSLTGIIPNGINFLYYQFDSGSAKILSGDVCQQLKKALISDSFWYSPIVGGCLCLPAIAHGGGLTKGPRGPQWC